MNHKKEIENLKNRLTQLRQALKSGNSRCSTPTQSRSKANSRDVSPTREIKLSPLTRSSAWKNSNNSKSPSASTTPEVSSIFSKKSNPRIIRKNANESHGLRPMTRNKSQVQEMSDKTDKLRISLSEEINTKIRVLGNLQDSVEHLKYLLANKKNEMRSELDKNLFLNVYLIKNSHNETGNRGSFEQINRDIENMKIRLDLLRNETDDVYSEVVSAKDSIDMINPLMNKMKNDNTVIKVIYN